MFIACVTCELQAHPVIGVDVVKEWQKCTKFWPVFCDSGVVLAWFLNCCFCEALVLSQCGSGVVLVSVSVYKAYGGVLEQ